MLVCLFNKVAGMIACNFIKETPTQVVSCETNEFFKKTYFEDYLRITASIIHCEEVLNSSGTVSIDSNDKNVAYTI